MSSLIVVPPYPGLRFLRSGASDRALREMIQQSDDPVEVHTSFSFPSHDPRQSGSFLQITDTPSYYPMWSANARGSKKWRAACSAARRFLCSLGHMALALFPAEKAIEIMEQEDAEIHRHGGYRLGPRRRPAPTARQARCRSPRSRGHNTTSGAWSGRPRESSWRRTGC